MTIDRHVKVLASQSLRNSKRKLIDWNYLQVAELNKLADCLVKWSQGDPAAGVMKPVVHFGSGGNTRRTEQSQIFWRSQRYFVLLFRLGKTEKDDEFFIH